LLACVGMLTDISNKCPAFSSECPFKNLKDEQAIASALSQCPAFAKGECPFRTCASVEEILDVFGRLPVLHVDLPALPELLKMMHDRSSALRLEMGLDECPLFSMTSANGCPFKTVTTGGQPLVAELERMSWAQALLARAPTVPSAEAADMTLSRTLKEGTKATHKAAENVHFVREFLKGRVPLRVYQAMVVDLYHVYTALEAAADACRSDPHFGSVHFPEELSRVGALAKDLEHFFGAGWRDDPSCSPSEAARGYVARLRQVSEEHPALLIAHSYTRYMGDLSGGRVLMRVAIKTYGLAIDTGGVNFYQFEQIGNPKEFKNRFRASLDGLPISAALSSQLVVEANAAFQLNIDLFRHLDTLMGLADRPPERIPAGECPFGFTGKGGRTKPSTPAAASDGGIPAAAPPPISNCPVHLTFYTSRLRRLLAHLLPPDSGASAAPPPISNCPVHLTFYTGRLQRLARRMSQPGLFGRAALPVALAGIFVSLGARCALQ